MKCADCGEVEVSDSETMCQKCSDFYAIEAAVPALMRTAIDRRAGLHVAASIELLRQLLASAQMAAAA